MLSLGYAPRKVSISSIGIVSAGDHSGISIASIWPRLLANATEAVSAVSIAISIAGVTKRPRRKTVCRACGVGFRLAGQVVCQFISSAALAREPGAAKSPAASRRCSAGSESRS